MNMRPGSSNNNNKQRGRGRGRGKHHGGGGGGGGGGGQRHQGGQQNQDQVFNIHRTIDSNGPDVKIRGNANHIYEKYLQLARDANSSGDRVMAENYLQHAEHYYRLIMAYQAHIQQQQGQHQQQQHGQPYGGGQQAQGHQQGQGGHYGGPYRNQPSASEGGTAGAYDQANGNGHSHDPAVVTASASGSQDDSYSEENTGRYD